MCDKNHTTLNSYVQPVHRNQLWEGIAILAENSYMFRSNMQTQQTPPMCNLYNQCFSYSYQTDIAEFLDWIGSIISWISQGLCMSLSKKKLENIMLDEKKLISLQFLIVFEGDWLHIINLGFHPHCSAMFCRRLGFPFSKVDMNITTAPVGDPVH